MRKFLIGTCLLLAACQAPTAPVVQLKVPAAKPQLPVPLSPRIDVIPSDTTRLRTE